MHTPIHQLLSIRDGEPVDIEVRQHAETCATCSAELNRLKRMQDRLQALEMPEPPAAAWDQIRARVPDDRAARGRRIAFATAAAIASLAILTGLWLRQPDSRGAVEIAKRAGEEIVPQASEVSFDHLVAQSRELDELLSYLPARPAVERVAVAATIDTIEQRVQWLDQQLTYAPAAGLDDSSTYQLWRERVDLMDSLVKVRYAEGGPLSF